MRCLIFNDVFFTSLICLMGIFSSLIEMPTSVIVIRYVLKVKQFNLIDFFEGYCV